MIECTIVTIFIGVLCLLVICAIVVFVKYTNSIDKKLRTKKDKPTKKMPDKRERDLEHGPEKHVTKRQDTLGRTKSSSETYSLKGTQYERLENEEYDTHPDHFPSESVGHHTKGQKKKKKSKRSRGSVVVVT